MESMFEGCSSLTELDISDFDMSNAWDTRSLFKDCSNLAKLDLGEWNLAKAEDFGNMFAGCDKLSDSFIEEHTPEPIDYDA